LRGPFAVFGVDFRSSWPDAGRLYHRRDALAPRRRRSTRPTDRWWRPPPLRPGPSPLGSGPPGRRRPHAPSGQPLPQGRRAHGRRVAGRWPRSRRSGPSSPEQRPARRSPSLGCRSRPWTAPRRPRRRADRTRSSSADQGQAPHVRRRLCTQRTRTGAPRRGRTAPR
jgi:hypothetical protein